MSEVDVGGGLLITSLVDLQDGNLFCKFLALFIHLAVISLKFVSGVMDHAECSELYPQSNHGLI